MTSSKTKYRLLALDVDGTLVGRDNVVSSEIRRAVAAAARAGMRVCIATGRSLVETLPVWRQLELPEPYEPMVLIGGALVSEPARGRSLWQRAMTRESACRFADALGRHGFSAMAIVDAWRHKTEYFLAESGDMHAVQKQWFAKMNVSVRRGPRLADIPDMPDPLRISAVTDPAVAPKLAEELRSEFADELRIHAILARNYGVTIIEAFDKATDKFAGVRYVAQAYRVGPGGIVAVGDDVNDLEMIRGAGLGVAMPQATDEVKTQANVTADDGLAAFVDRLLEGRYD